MSFDFLGGYLRRGRAFPAKREGDAQQFSGEFDQQVAGVRLPTRYRKQASLHGHGLGRNPVPTVLIQRGKRLGSAFAVSQGRITGTREQRGLPEDGLRRRLASDLL